MDAETAVTGDTCMPNSATQLVRPFGEHKHGNRQKLMKARLAVTLQSVRSSQLKIYLGSIVRAAPAEVFSDLARVITKIKLTSTVTSCQSQWSCDDCWL